MSYYHVCPNCGANLDPGERCDCQLTEYRSGIASDGMVNEPGGTIPQSAALTAPFAQGSLLGAEA